MRGRQWMGSWGRDAQRGRGLLSGFELRTGIGRFNRGEFCQLPAISVTALSYSNQGRCGDSKPRAKMESPGLIEAAGTNRFKRGKREAQCLPVSPPFTLN